MSFTREMDPGNDAADMLEVPESSDSDDYESPGPALPSNRATKGFCKCGRGVGDYFNSWIKITGSYYLPALLGSYSSLLRAVGHQRPASIGTELDGCTIQPLRCPCDETLGFHVVDAPADKEHFRGRDFFKLERIQLQCEVGPDRFIAVEPQYTTLDTFAVTDSPNSVVVAGPSAAAMEIDSRPAPPMPGPMHHYKHHQLHQQQQQHRELTHQPLQQVEINRQSLPPPPSRSPPTLLPSNAPHKSPSNPSLPSPAVQPVKPAREAHHVLPPPPPREIIASPAHHMRELPAPVTSHHQSPIDQHPKDQGYPRSPQHVQLDAIERLQIQISQNSSALVAQSRDMRRCEEVMQQHEESLRREFQSHLHQQSSEIRRVDDAVGRLQHEMRGIRELLEVLRREFHVSGGVQGRAAAPPAPSVQDSALELMAQQIAVISAKANDVETLKITIEIMKNKIQRLESTAVASPAQTAARQYASPREPAPRSLPPSQHTVPSHHSTPSAPSHPGAPASAAQKMQSYDAHSRPHSRSLMATPETSQRTEPPPEARPTPSGWATVNAGMKRTLSGGLNSPQDSIGPTPESPKRTKLAPIEPRAAYANSQGQLQHVYDHMDTDDSDAARVQTHRHTLPSQPQSTMSVIESTVPSQHSHAAILAYGTQEAPSDDSWRPESQRIIQVRTPRGRGSRGGPGSRGGRVRKSMAAQIHPISTPEWERVDWQGVSDSQVSPDGYYTMPRMNRPIVRRGSGGGGSGSRGGRPTSSNGRAASVSLGLQGVTAGTGVGLPADPYAHTKKTRTKPIRNADGVLIRKDGRPDMRSQSSAANLRKVHSRTGGSENPEGHEREFTPSQQYTPNGSVGTSSPMGGSPGEHDLSASVRKKHNDVMNRMFPSGFDESRKELDHVRKVFEENEDRTVHPRTQQAHYHHHEGPASRPLEIKREQMEETRFADTQSPNNGDVDMDRQEDHADDEGQTPGGQSDTSGQQAEHHERIIEETQQIPLESQTQSASISTPAPAPESTTESSATLPPASSTQTLAASSAQQS